MSGDYAATSAQASPLGTSKVNPFIDKSDIYNHKRRQSKIEERKDAIQDMYRSRGILSHAQSNVVQKNMRDTYYAAKMQENFGHIDRELKARKDIRHYHTLQNKDDNQHLARKRSDEQIKLMQAIRKQDVKAAMADVKAANAIAMKEKQLAL